MVSVMVNAGCSVLFVQPENRLDNSRFVFLVTCWSSFPRAVPRRRLLHRLSLGPHPVDLPPHQARVLHKSTRPAHEAYWRDRPLVEAVLCAAVEARRSLPKMPQGHATTCRRNFESPQAPYNTSSAA